MRDTSPDLVRRALTERDPPPGTAGFAGELDGRLVWDVLGRQPLFSERADPMKWSFDHHDLDDPVVVPAGRARQAAGEAAGDNERVWSLPDPPVATDRDAALDRVRDAVFESIRSVDDDDLAVVFSGDVDSAAVAAGAPDAPCYIAGFKGSHDVTATRKAAAAMDRDLTMVELTHEAPERAVPEVVAAFGRMTPMDAQIVLPLYLLAERIATDGYDRLTVGQGAGELFGGYAKIQKVPDDPCVEADTVRGATRKTILTLPDQLERNLFALRATGVDLVAPFLHDRVVSAALPLPEEFLVDGDRRKVALREAASGVLSESVAEADKEAVQYGTYASRELDRLARQVGFKRRMESRVQQYVESLVE